MPRPCASSCAASRSHCSRSTCTARSSRSTCWSIRGAAPPASCPAAGSRRGRARSSRATRPATRSSRRRAGRWPSACPTPGGRSRSSASETARGRSCSSRSIRASEAASRSRARRGQTIRVGSSSGRSACRRPPAPTAGGPTSPCCATTTRSSFRGGAAHDGAPDRRLRRHALSRARLRAERLARRGGTRAGAARLQRLRRGRLDALPRGGPRPHLRRGARPARAPRRPVARRRAGGDLPRSPSGDRAVSRGRPRRAGAFPPCPHRDRLRRAAARAGAQGRGARALRAVRSDPAHRPLGARVLEAARAGVPCHRGRVRLRRGGVRLRRRQPPEGLRRAAPARLAHGARAPRGRRARRARGACRGGRRVHDARGAAAAPGGGAVMRRAAPLLVLFATALGVAEGLAYLILTRVPAARACLRRDLDRLRDAVTAEDVRAFRDHGWDARLGWTAKPGTRGEAVGPDHRVWRFAIDARGARRNPLGTDRGWISAYGDSFAFCAEVDDDETWEVDLSRLAHTTVANFGVSAYGPDQALWRLEQHLPADATRVVVLTVMSEDIGRLLSMYRPFYLQETALRVGFKPMLVPIGERFAVLPNPLARADGRADFLAAFEAATRHDFWYRLDQKRPPRRFPYLLTLARAVRYALLDAVDLGTLYDRDLGRRRLLYVIDRFVALGAQYDFTPVLLFIPAPGELRHARRGRYAYTPFVERLRTRPDLARLRIVDLAQASFAPERFNTLPFVGHASPYGNRVIAEAVFAAIQDLAPTGADPTAAAQGERR